MVHFKIQHVQGNSTVLIKVFSGSADRRELPQNKELVRVFPYICVLDLNVGLPWLKWILSCKTIGYCLEFFFIQLINTILKLLHRKDF